MAEYLFVYGLLLPALAPAELADVICSLEAVGRARVQGRLYDLGHYPGAIVEAESDSCINGVIYRLPPTRSVLSLLDQFEDVNATNPDEGLYVRLKAMARLEDGQELEVWIYQYNKDLTQAEYLPDGDYGRRLE
jgi:gamma-glutamylcyclotransferase (GGCT)/AIG2-like uncharacterized protein YtfP